MISPSMQVQPTICLFVVPMYDGVMAARKVSHFLRGLNLGTHVGWRAGAGECLMLIVTKNTPVLAMKYQ